MENIDQRGKYYENTPDNVQHWFKVSGELLERSFGVEDLSNNEKFILMKISEDAMDRYDPSVHAFGNFLMDKEIVSRFLMEAYGINPDMIKKNTDTDEDMDNFREFIRRTRANAHLI